MTHTGWRPFGRDERILDMGAGSCCVSSMYLNPNLDISEPLGARALRDEGLPNVVVDALTASRADASLLRVSACPLARRLALWWTTSCDR